MFSLLNTSLFRLVICATAILALLLIPVATIDAQDYTVRSMPSPEGCKKPTFPGNSYSAWIQNLPLKNDRRIVNFRQQEVRSSFYNVFAVVNMPLLFKADLEQCADFAMRFWAEYHKSTGKLDKLYLFDYHGKKQLYSQSGLSYRDFLKRAFARSNSYSIKAGAKTIEVAELSPGDMFVQNQKGGIGHVSIILDTCELRTGQRFYLIGYSFMPAQEFHIEKADSRYGLGGWFTLEGYYRYLKENLDYGPAVLRRFKPL